MRVWACAVGCGLSVGCGAELGCAGLSALHGWALRWLRVKQAA